MSGLSYRDSGVDVAGAEEFIRSINALVASTQSDAVVDHPSRFAGLMRTGGDGGARTLLAATCDGVGTKLLLAAGPDDYEGLGVDLVAMSVNDLLPLRARPLFFLDYLAAGRLDRERMTAAIRGIARGCRAAGCALLGGETAEMPDMYPGGELEMVGFAVGEVVGGSPPDPETMTAGDVVVALPSTGLHSNGFSLARKALFERGRLEPNAPHPGIGGTLRAVLLTPTAIYVDAAHSLMDAVPIKASAHVTGGGLHGRAAALLSGGLDMRIDLGAFPRPPIFDVVAAAGDISPAEMAATFNLGLGYLAVLAKNDAAEALDQGWLEVGALSAGSGEVVLAVG